MTGELSQTEARIIDPNEKETGSHMRIDRHRPNRLITVPT
jgi:hypothetical protein